MAPDTAHATQHTERPQRLTNAKSPRPPHKQRATPSEHTTKQPNPRTNPVHAVLEIIAAAQHQPAKPPEASQAARSTVEEGRVGQGGEKGRQGKVREDAVRGARPPPTRTQPTVARRGHSRAPTKPSTKPYRLSEKECVPAAVLQHGQARSARQTQHAPRGTTRQHNSGHPRLTTSTQPRTSPAVSTAQQRPSGWICGQPAANPTPAGYKTAAVRTNVCAPGSEPSPCRLRNSRHPDGRVRGRR